MGAERDERPPAPISAGDLVACRRDGWLGGGDYRKPAKGEIVRVTVVQTRWGLQWLQLEGFDQHTFWAAAFFARISPDVEPATDEFAGFLHAALADYRRAQERRP